MPFGMENAFTRRNCATGADAALPMAELQLLEDAATVAVQDATKSPQSQLLKRPIALQGIDLELARAIVSTTPHTTQLP